MNLYLATLMDAPSLTPGHCIVCGRAYPTAHHVVPRSQGGKDGPVLHLCGDGTRGCHGKAEDKRLHFRYRDAWQHIETRPMKYEMALRGVQGEFYPCKPDIFAATYEEADDE